MSELSVGQLKGLTVNNNTITVPSGHKIYEPGSVVQVLYATSGYTNQTITSTTPVALSGMSITITPKFATSRIVIQAAVNASWTYVSSIHVFRNGSTLGTSHANNSQTGGSTSIWTRYDNVLDQSTGSVITYPLLFSDVPGTTSALTYDLRANSGWAGGSNTFYFNNRGSNDMLSSSHMTVMEIAQ